MPRVGSRWGVCAALAVTLAAGPAVAALAAGSDPGPTRGASGGEEERIQFHGYGEIHYNNPQTGTMSGGASNELDFHRFVLGWEYEFTEKARVEAEVDYEHAARELELEEAFIEYDISPSVAFRVGSLLMPVGPLNEFHEPPLYYSVERPYVQRVVIPTTWQENGAGFAGQAGAGAVSYRAYVTAGLDASKITSLDGLHDVSTKGSESKADDLAGVGRVEYAPALGLLLGGSGYYGGADQRMPGLGAVALALVSADARYHRAGFDLRGVYARVTLDGADSVSALVGETVGEAMQGWYVEAAYDLLRARRAEGARRSLVLFGRHESFDTNAKVPSGFARNAAAKRKASTVGVAYYPIEKIAFKGDFEHWKDGAGAKLDRVNLGAAFMF